MTSLGIVPPPPGWSSPSRPDNVTAIAADQAVSFSDESDPSNTALPARLGVFYQSGGFVILHLAISAGRLVWDRETIHPPHTRPRSTRRRANTYTSLEGDSVVLATIHYPVVITCTSAFHLTFYSLLSPDGSKSGRPIQTGSMHSDVSFHPATLSLFPTSDSTQRFRAALTYCTPLYPYSWTVAVQEFHIRSRSISGLTDITRGECWNVGRGDEDVPQHVWPRTIRPIVGVKGRPVGVGTDGRWTVLAGEDNQIQVYSLPTTKSTPGTSKPLPISHSHTLLAHSAAITSISLASGRVISGGRDGRVLVWELDEDVDLEDSLRGRTVAYVEVRPGGRRPKWRGAAGPHQDEDDSEEREEGLPHPQSISGPARSLFLPRLPEGFERKAEKERDTIRQLAFDEEKIVGLVREGQGEVMKVWGFNT